MLLNNKKNWIGAFWKILSSIGFAIIGGLAKGMSKGIFPDIPPLSIYQIIFIENFIALTIIIILQKHLFFQNLQKKIKILEIIRVLLASFGTLIWYTAIFFYAYESSNCTIVHRSCNNNNWCTNILKRIIIYIKICNNYN